MIFRLSPYSLPLFLLAFDALAAPMHRLGDTDGVRQWGEHIGSNSHDLVRLNNGQQEASSSLNPEKHGHDPYETDLERQLMQHQPEYPKLIEYANSMSLVNFMKDKPRIEHIYPGIFQTLFRNRQDIKDIPLDNERDMIRYIMALRMSQAPTICRNEDEVRDARSAKLALTHTIRNHLKRQGVHRNSLRELQRVWSRVSSNMVSYADRHKYLLPELRTDQQQDVASSMHDHQNPLLGGIPRLDHGSHHHLGQSIEVPSSLHERHAMLAGDHYLPSQMNPLNNPLHNSGQSQIGESSTQGHMLPMLTHMATHSANTNQLPIWTESIASAGEDPCPVLFGEPVLYDFVGSSKPPGQQQQQPPH